MTYKIRAIYNLPSGDVRPLEGHRGFNRLCVGSYRIIYTVDNREWINEKSSERNFAENSSLLFLFERIPSISRRKLFPNIIVDKCM